METYRLAVCEDEEKVREEIQDFCDSILRDMRIQGDITAFASAQELERELDGGRKFDTLILDIQMEEKEMSGMDLARLLRKRGDRTGIIFVSGYEEYLLEGYSVQPVRFLSSDDTIASVTRTGKITARTKGTCFIYACAISGKTAKIKITVR